MLTETPEVCHQHFHVTLHPQESFELQQSLHADRGSQEAGATLKLKPANGNHNPGNLDTRTISQLIKSRQSAAPSIGGSVWP